MDVALRDIEGQLPITAVDRALRLIAATKRSRPRRSILLVQVVPAPWTELDFHPGIRKVRRFFVLGSKLQAAGK